MHSTNQSNGDVSPVGRSGLRRHRQIRTVGIFSLLAFLTLRGTGIDIVVFGPQTYVRGTGQPITVSNSFRITSSSGAYTLIVENHGVTSAVVSLNGKTILGPSDFTGQSTANATLQRVVALIAGTNRVVVELRSKPGSWLSVEILGSRIPVVSDLEPAQLTVAAGGVGSLTVTLQNPDPQEAMHVALTSGDATVAAVPAEVILPAGATTGSVSVTGGVSGGPVPITAALNGTSATAEVTVRDRPLPPALTEPLVEGATVVGGSGVANALLDVLVDGAVAGLGTVGSNGQFGVTVTALRTGQRVTATQTIGGLTSLPSAAVTVRARPPAPTVTPPLVAGSTQVPGTGSPVATITIFVDGAVAATGLAATDGTFMIAVPFALAAGQQVNATQTVAGVTSIPSAAVTVVERPAPPSVVSPLIEGGTSVTGTGSMGATVEAFNDGTLIGTAIVNGSGTWTLALTAPLVAGQHIKARQTVGGIASAFSAEVIVVARPPAPIVNTPLVEGSTGVGGRGVAGASVAVLIDSVAVGTTLVGGDGKWTLALGSSLVAGQRVTAAQTVGGIQSDFASAVTVVARPPAPTVTSPLVDGMTAVAGVGIGGATLELFVGSNAVGTGTVGNTGSWVVPLGAALVAGQQVAARQTVAGITSVFSAAVTVIEGPPAPMVSAPLVAGEMTVSGSGIPRAGVQVFANGVALGTTAIAGNGAWTLPLSTELVAGQQITAQQTLAGITSAPSAPVTVQAAFSTIEITPAPSLTLTKNQRVQFLARGIFSDGTVQEPLADVTWISDNAGVASLTQAGLATATSAGIGHIQATLGGVASSMTALTVRPLPPVVTPPITAGAAVVSGTGAEPAASVQIFVNGTPRGSATVADGSGLWSATDLSPVLAANDSVTALQTAAGIPSNLSPGVIVVAAPAVLAEVLPPSGQQGQQNLSVVVTGQFTHWTQGTTAVSFGAGITVASLIVDSATTATAAINIDSAAAIGPRTVTVTAGSEVASLANGFTVLAGVPALLSVVPPSGVQGQLNLPVSIAGQFAHFVQGASQVTFGGGITVISVTVASATSLTAVINVDPSALLGTRTVTVTTGSEVVAQTNGFLVNGPSCFAAPPGIVGWWPGEGNATDLAGGHNGALGSEVSFADGKVGKGFSFAGETFQNPGSIVIIPHDDALSLSAVTMEAWVLVNHVPDVFAPIADWVIASKGISIGTAENYGLYVQNVGNGTLELLFEFYAPLGLSGSPRVIPHNGFVWVISNGSGLTPGSLHHLAATADGDFIKFYVDGLFISQEPQPEPLHPNNIQLQIGSASPYGDRFNGVIDELSVYNRALTSSEIHSIYAAGSAGKCPVVPALTSASPAFGVQGQQNLSATITGAFTHFTQGITTASFGTGITVVSVTVNSAAAATAVIAIDPMAATGARTVTVTTGTEVVSLANGFTVTAGTPALLSVNPNTGQQAQQNLSVTITGQLTHWVQGATTANFGPGVTVASLAINSPTQATAVLDVNFLAALGPRTVSVTAGFETVSLNSAFTVFAQEKSVNASWQFFVAESFRNDVLRYDGVTGAFVSTFVPTGSGGLNDRTVQARFGPDGNLYVGSWALGNILRYNGVTGDFIDAFTAPGAGGLGAVQDMRFGPDGNLFATNGGSVVLRFNGTTGQFIDTFVPSGSGGLSGAFDFAFGPDGNLYVTSLSTNKILRYDGKTGAFLGVFASHGSLVGPNGMTFGPDNNLYVSGYGSLNIVRFDGTTGAFIDVFVPQGSGGLAYPGSIAFGPDGNLYELNYLDAGNVLRYDGKTGAFMDVFVPPAGLRLSKPVSVTFRPFASIALNGGNTLNGLPIDSTFNVSWSKVSGPGPVFFSNPTAVATVATFNTVGTYVVRLIVNNGQVAGSADVSIAANAPALLSNVTPDRGQRGQQNLLIDSTGIGTHFVQGVTQLNLGPDITVGSVTVANSGILEASVSVSAAAALGPRTFLVATGSEVESLTFTVTADGPTLASVAPSTASQGQTLSVAIVGQNTHFTQGTSLVSFGSDIGVNSVTVTDAVNLAANITISAGAAIGPHTITVTTGAEVVSLGGFSVTGAASLTRIDITPAGTVTLTKGQTGQFSARGTFSDNSIQEPLIGVMWTSEVSMVASITVAGLATGLAAGVSHIAANKSGVQSATTNFVVKPLAIALFGPITAGAAVVDGAAAEPGASVRVSVNGLPRGPTTVADSGGLWTVSGFTPALAVGDSVTAVQTVNGVASDTSDAIIVTAGTPTLLSVNPATGTQGQQNLNVAITGQFTHFVQGVSQVFFASSTITVNSVTVASATSLTANISIALKASLVPRTVSVTTGSEVAALANAFTVGAATNQPPVITIAPTWSDELPNRLTMNYAVTDDGLPLGGALTVSWQGISGPGNVGFQNQTPTSISAGFDQAGTYVLRITATDTQLTVHQDVTVTVTGTAPPPPTVSITTPSDGAEITGPLSVIGSVTSAALASWALEFRMQAESAFRPIATGTTPVTNTALGTLDPTLLLNGLGLLQLRATDTTGQTATFGPISVVVTQNQKIGNFTVSFNDLTVPVAGLPIQVVRTYDSRNKTATDFGVGWTLDLSAVTLTTSGGALGDHWVSTSTGGSFPTYCIQSSTARLVTITFVDGTVFQFQAALNPACQQLVPLDQTAMGFTPISTTPPNATLAVIGNNQLLVSGAQPGPVTLLDLDDVTTFDPDLYQLTMPDGRALVISKKQGLQSMTDPNGNKLTVTPNGITHSGGRSVTFQRDASNRITQITDPAGQPIAYSYDANGDLATVTDRANNATTFAYNAMHGLLTITDPRGVQPIKNVYDDNGRLIEHVDAFGHTITYTHDLNAHEEIVTDRLGNLTINAYDANGNVVRVTDALGGVTTRTYDAHNNLVTETNPLHQTRIYTYDANNNRLTDTDPLGKTTSYTYNTRNQVLTVTDPQGRVTTNTYDGNNNLTSTTDAMEKTTAYAYGARGLRTSTTDPLGNMTQYQYDAAGNVTQQTDALSHTTSYTYDANGNRLTESKTQTTSNGVRSVVTQYQYDGLNHLTQTTFADGGTIRTTYNSIGKQAVTIDQLGRQTTYEYDLMGRLTKTTFPDGTTELATYDAEGERVTSADRAGRITSYAYDPLKRLTQTTFADGATSESTYDATGQFTAVVDARGNVTQYAYDAAGRRTSVTDALGHVTSFSYDSVGNQVSMKDANENVAQYQYDGDNRRVKTIYADGSSDSVAYDALGRTVSKTDQAGVITQFRYDALGHLIAVIDALGQPTTHTYDELGNRTSQTDTNGHVTQFGYDALGRRIGRTLPLGMTESSTYDAAGSLASKTDFNGNTTSYSYDSVNRLVSKIPDPTFGEAAVQFAFSATGQRTQMIDASGTTTYAYDLRDRMLTKATPQGTLTYTYDPAGDLASIRSSNAGGTSIDYTYDALNRLATVTDNRLAGGMTTYAYDGVGNLAGFVYPNGVSHAYTFNALNRLTSLAVADRASATLASYSYTLGPTGNRTSVTEFGGRRVDYTYDNLYRLTVETITGAIGGTTTYSYDPVGNRLAQSSPSTGLVMGTYDANDRLTTDAYDNNGNTAGSGVNVFAYDFENHLTGENNGAVSIVYDGDGNRVAKTVSGVTTRYFVDDRNLTGYAQVLEELSGGAVQRVYTHGLNRISQSQASGTSFYGYDGHGSVRLLTNATGAVSDRYDYDAFGNIISQSGTTPNVYLYSGEQNDPNVGFYFLRTRYYEPRVGRFMTSDSYSGSVFDPPSLHHYAYVANNSVNRMDPTGQFSVSELLTAVTISQILQQITLPHFVFAAATVVTLEALVAPGFEMRNTALRLLSGPLNPQLVVVAQELYEEGEYLIRVGTSYIKVIGEVTSIGQTFVGISGSVRALAQAVNQVAQGSQAVVTVAALLELPNKVNNTVVAADNFASAISGQATSVPQLPSILRLLSDPYTKTFIELSRLIFKILGT